ncbi:hypothetical protein, partial [Aeromonas sobria]|uniref:hypothetical protein n=1 Tax=Aeromonas sobria TaxID=646 RepID=UPI003F3F5F64
TPQRNLNMTRTNGNRTNTTTRKISEIHRTTTDLTAPIGIGTPIRGTDHNLAKDMIIAIIHKIMIIALIHKIVIIAIIHKIVIIVAIRKIIIIATIQEIEIIEITILANSITTNKIIAINQDLHQERIIAQTQEEGNHQNQIMTRTTDQEIFQDAEAQKMKDMQSKS